MSSEGSTNNALILLLQQAVAGLLWVSESEAPLDVVVWPVSADQPFTPETLLQATQQPRDTPIQPLSFAALFQPVLQEQDWFGDAERHTLQQWQSLYHLLQTTLPAVQVYRVGMVEVDVYIVRRVTPTQVIGLHTRLVET